MSAMILTLGRPAESAEVRLGLPASQEEVDRVLSALDGYAEDSGKPVVVQDVQCEIPGIYQYICWADIGRQSDLRKLNQLADRISGMDSRECALFAGALDAESISGLDDVLKLSGHLGDYVLLPNITSDVELGRFLVDTGYKDFPEAVRPYLDYRAIGAEYYADQGGAYGPGGYVRHKSSVEQITEDRPAQITIHLRILEAPGTVGKTCRLSLPATDEELDMAKTTLDVGYFTEAAIDRIEFSTSYLEEIIPQDGFCVEDANELALCLREMEREDGALMKYCAALSVERPDSFSEAVNIAMDRDDYERVPDDMDEYGKQVLRRAGADDEILDTIDGFMDFAGLGEASLVEDGVRRTEFGLVRRVSAPFPAEQETGPQGMGMTM